MTGLSARFQEYAQAAWQKRAKRLGGQAGAWEREIDAAGEEAPLLRYVLATLPLSDLGEYPASLFAQAVRHACRVREEFPWCGSLPEHLFLKDVLYPRVNTEELSACRPLFYGELAPRVRGLSLEGAILEVNRWCAEQVTYRSTDNRTSPPLAVFRRGWGRCGEESTFAVEALRSVGIAARQVYAPWWSHCDDNHAWVEAWDGGAWRYLGACEPEPELDRGWFTGAAARAMLIHTRSFTGELPAPPWLYPGTEPLDLDVREGVCYETITARYAPVKACTATVREPDGAPAEGARLTFSLLNMAAYRPIARRTTDGEGRACLHLGLGTVYVTAEKDGRAAEALWDTGGSQALRLELPVSQGLSPQTSRAFQFASPAAPEAFPPPLSPEQKAARKATLEQAEASRREKQAARREKAGKEAARLTERVSGLLGDGGDASCLVGRVLALLPRKDRADGVPPEVIACCARALRWEKDFPPEVFNQALFSPRIGLEPLKAWEGEDFPGLQAAACEQADPKKAWQWVQEHIALADTYGGLPQSPSSALKLKAAGKQGRRALFCGICRALGVPARLSPLDGVPEYWQEGSFCRVEKPEEACLCLLNPAGRSALQGQDYSLSRWEGGAWQVLSTGRIHGGEKLSLKLSPGLYRLLAVLRLPCGDLLARQADIPLAPGDRGEASLCFPQAQRSQLLQSLPLPPFSLIDSEGQAHPGREVLEKAPVTLFCWLEPGREPTEHLLLELKDAAAGFAAHEDFCQIHLVTPQGGQEDPALLQALQALPQARLWQADMGEVPALSRQLFTDPERLPLVLLADDANRGLYACGGYNVGVAALLLRLLEKDS